MTNTDAAREAARQSNGEFGAQEHARPTRGLPTPPDDILTAFDGKDGYPFDMYGGWDCDSDEAFATETLNVSAALQEVHGYPGVPGGLIFDPEPEEDGIIETYKIGVSLDDGTYLATDLHPMSDLGEPGLREREAALFMANHMDKQYRELRAMAEASGRLKPATETENRDQLLAQYREVNQKLDESTIRCLAETANDVAPGADTLIVGMGDQGMFLAEDLRKDGKSVADIYELAWWHSGSDQGVAAEKLHDFAGDLSENGFWTAYAKRIPGPHESYEIDLKTAAKAGME